MTVNYADVVFTLTGLKVAPWLVGNSYSPTAVDLGYPSELSFTIQADADQIKALGMLVELLSVITHVEGKIKNAALDSEASYVMTGHATTSSGSTPNRTGTIDYIAGGAGMPYFGVVGSLAGLNGSNLLVGIRKAKLNMPPAMVVEQNKFRMADTDFKGVVPDTTTGKLFRLRKYETAGSIPTDLNTFFT